LQYLFAWHKDAHGADGDYARDFRPVVDRALEILAADISSGVST
jgi:hypothetical protein